MSDAAIHEICQTVLTVGAGTAALVTFLFMAMDWRPFMSDVTVTVNAHRGSEEVDDE